LLACLEALAHLTTPREAWQVVVVNDGGQDPQLGVPPALRASYALRFVNAPHRGPAAARNLAARQARGDFLAFTDDDCRPEPDWLDQFERAFRAGPWDALAGRALNAHAASSGARAQQYLIDFMQGYRLPNGDVTSCATTRHIAA
jgi:glycosyltransferase involved in cell wall biosynthesis